MFSKLDWLGLILWSSLTYGVGHAVASAITSGRFSSYLRDSNVYYHQPPSIVFSSIWMVLFTLDAISVLLIWQTEGALDVALWEISLACYVAQLILVGMWSPLCFNYKSIKLAMAVILFSFLMALCNGIFFFLQHTVAGLLMLPYVIWMIFLVYFTMGLALSRSPPLGSTFLVDSRTPIRVSPTEGVKPSAPPPTSPSTPTDSVTQPLVMNSSNV